jgi:hypothetical protein
MCQFFLVIALETALHSLWLCGLPEDRKEMQTLWCHSARGSAVALDKPCRIRYGRTKRGGAPLRCMYALTPTRLRVLKPTVRLG